MIAVFATLEAVTPPPVSGCGVFTAVGDVPPQAKATKPAASAVNNASLLMIVVWLFVFVASHHRGSSRHTLPIDGRQGRASRRRGLWSDSPDQLAVLPRNRKGRLWASSRVGQLDPCSRSVRLAPKHRAAPGVTIRQPGWGRRPTTGGSVAIAGGWSYGVIGGLDDRRPGPTLPRYGRDVAPVSCMLHHDLLRRSKVAHRATRQVRSGDGPSRSTRCKLARPVQNRRLAACPRCSADTRGVDITSAEDTREALEAVSAWVQIKDSDNSRPKAAVGGRNVLTSKGRLAEAGGNRTHRSGGQPGAGRL
jgi:hypothetical protein